VLGTPVVDTIAPAATTQYAGPSFGNIAVILVLLAVVYPVVVWLRKRVSDRRVARWAEEEQRGSGTPTDDIGDTDDWRTSD
jgi:hypothetical protein